MNDYTGIDNCIMEVATNFKNPKFCNGISDKTQRANCVGLINVAKGKTNACDNLPSGQQDTCLINLAQKTGDISLCQKMANEQNKNYCIGSLTSAKISNPTDCQKLPSQGNIDSCLSAQAVANGDISLCGKIQDPNVDGQCVVGVAGTSGAGVADCAYAPNEVWKSNCYQGFPTGKNGIDNCLKLDNVQNDQNTCITNIARRAGNSDACKTIQDPDSQYYCLMVIGIDKKDLSICDYNPGNIKTQDVKNYCYSTYATFNHDPSVCEKIPAGSTWKNTCSDK
jgi:hypothetical protein